MKKLKGLAIAALLSTVSTAAMAQDPLDIVFTVHSGASNTFWQAVQKGYEDACAKVGATCQMVYVQTDGSIAEQVANMEAALARQPDALITSIIDNTAFDDVIQRARDAGVVVDSGLALAVVADRVGAYLSAHPETNAYFDTGFWHAGVAGVLRDRGIEPGKVLLGGFDLVPIVLDEMDSGYIQVEVDQQPYEQGFMPVMMVYLSKTVGLSPVDINTGEALVYPKDVAAVRDLSEKGLR